MKLDPFVGRADAQLCKRAGITFPILGDDKRKRHTDAVEGWRQASIDIPGERRPRRIAFVRLIEFRPCTKRAVDSKRPLILQIIQVLCPAAQPRQQDQPAAARSASISSTSTSSCVNERRDSPEYMMMPPSRSPL